VTGELALVREAGAGGDLRQGEVAAALQEPRGLACPRDVPDQVDGQEVGRRLGGSVWSSDRERAFQVAARIHSGMVWVNKHLDAGLDTPFAGAKQSGTGADMGQEGLEEFTQATIINMAK
jgi:hypothetical protein